MELKFRHLRADEVECRIAMVRENGLSLLLYKDARCDMNILDETVGAMNWQRSHSRENANCTVSIWDSEKQLWISKEDTGTESNTEKEKGLASDSFKRSCFNWGIGRELYTAPFIWLNASDTTGIKNGKCYDRFSVEKMEVKNCRITFLVIRNQNMKKNVFTYGKPAENAADTEIHEEDAKVPKKAKYEATEASEKDTSAERITGEELDDLLDLIDAAGVTRNAIMKAANVDDLRHLSKAVLPKLVKSLNAKIEKGNK